MTIPEIGTIARHASADHRADLQPHPRPARRRQAPLPVPVDRLPEPAARGGDRAPPRARASSQTLAVQVADAVSRMRDSDVQKPPGIAEAIDWLAALSLLGVERLDAAAVGPHARLGAEVRRGPGGRPRRRPRGARAQRWLTPARRARSGWRRSSSTCRRWSARFEPAPARRRRCPMTPDALGRLRARAGARPADRAPAAVLDRARRARLRSGAGRRPSTRSSARSSAIATATRPSTPDDATIVAGPRRRPAARPTTGPSRGGRRAARSARARDVVAAAAAATTTTDARGRRAAGDGQRRGAAARAGASTALEPARAGAALPADDAPAARHAAAPHAPRTSGAATAQRIDMRRTLRGSLRTGGDPIRLARRRRRVVPRRLVMLCDISGSMEPYARAYLQFLTCAAGSGPGRGGVRVRHAADAADPRARVPPPGARDPARRGRRRRTGRAAPASATR